MTIQWPLDFVANAAAWSKEFVTNANYFDGGVPFLSYIVRIPQDLKKNVNKMTGSCWTI